MVKHVQWLTFLYDKVTSNSFQRSSKLFSYVLFYFSFLKITYSRGIEIFRYDWAPRNYITYQFENNFDCLNYLYSFANFWFVSERCFELILKVIRMAKVSKCNVTSIETYQGYIGYKREAFNIFTLAVFNTN